MIKKINISLPNFAKKKEFFVPLFVLTLFFSVFLILEKLHKPEGSGESQANLSSGDSYLLVNTEDYNEDAADSFEAYDTDPSHPSLAPDTDNHSSDEDPNTYSAPEDISLEGES